MLRAVPETSSPIAGRAIDPRVQLARKVVLRLAVFVMLTLVTGLLFATYNFATDRPVKELFLSGDD